MSKSNKKRYQVKEKPKVTLTFTGTVWLRYRDDEELERPKKGDMMAHPSVDQLHDVAQGAYDVPRYAGYFRLDIFDGRDWQPVLLVNLFTENEHHFSKTERPLDTFLLIEELLKPRAGLGLVRTYREHYQFEE